MKDLGSLALEWSRLESLSLQLVDSSGWYLICPCLLARAMIYLAQKAYTAISC